MIFLTVEEIQQIHTKLISKTGGSDGVRDMALLESAVFSIQSSFDDCELYPTVEEKAARLCYALISNHAFVDGNKRIGILSMLLTLQLNDIFLAYAQPELVRLGLSAAAGEMRYAEILAWICAHKRRDPQ